LDWHGLFKSLIGIQRRKQGGVGDSSFWMAMDLISPNLSWPSVIGTGFS
jgi:hypothetical protein